MIYGRVVVVDTFGASGLGEGKSLFERFQATRCIQLGAAPLLTHTGYRDMGLSITIVIGILFSAQGYKSAVRIFRLKYAHIVLGAVGIGGVSAGCFTVFLPLGIVATPIYQADILY